MNSSKPIKEVVSVPSAGPQPTQLSRRVAGAVFFGVLVLAFAPTLVVLTMHVAQSQLHSYILLIPFISAYLLYIRREQLPKDYSSSLGLGLTAAIAGVAALALRDYPALRFSH